MLGEFTSERLLIEFEGMKAVLSQTARVVKVCADLSWFKVVGFKLNTKLFFVDVIRLTLTPALDDP